MDLLDSPLNLAHQQSRKADRYIKSARYDDAIECHRKAAEYLTKAMAATTIQQALESFGLQRESHIRQQALIREKQRRHLQQVTSGSATQLSISRTPASDTGSSDVNMSNSDKSIFLKTIHDTDALLQHLNNRAIKGRKIGTFREDRSDENLTEKTDKTIMEEMRTQNEALRGHFLEYMKENEEQQRQLSYLQRELDFCRKENRDLKDRLSKTERSPHDTMHDSIQSENLYSMPLGMNIDNLPSLELPPLEMPKFDFNTIKDDDNASQ